MPRRATLHAAVLLITTGLAAPAVAVAASSDSGGSGFAPPTSGSTGSSGTPAGRSVAVQPSVQAYGNGISFSSRSVALLRSKLRFSGTVSGATKGMIVEIERRGSQTGGRWVRTTHGSLRRGGGFTATWPVNRSGRFSFRAVLESGTGTASRATTSSPAVTITIYRSAIATIYGPGFYGNQTACGKTLRRNTLGVANRTLPCGTPVSLLWRGRTIVVPVIDRGPYANNADWDLTTATATALGMTETETIGAVSLPR